MDQSKLELIERYKQYARLTNIKDELYKWELVKTYHKKPNVYAEDFKTELLSIKFANLIFPQGISVLHQIVKQKPEEVRKAFQNLFDESISLPERLKMFNELTLSIYREVDQEHQYSHHQDERTMATYLAFYDSSKYPFYKHSFYKKYCDLIGEKTKSSGQKYIHYISLIKEFINDYILPDKELLELKKELLTENCCEDENHMVFAQDILYNMLERNVDEENESETLLPEKNFTLTENMNQILYGPPGTGKTYNTINKALELCGDILDGLSRSEITALYQKRVEEGRIVFTTFHQSMSYEDFVEGIKPDTNEEGNVVYDVQDGVFKALCQKAKVMTKGESDFNWKEKSFFKMSLGGKNEPDIHSWCLENDLIALGWGANEDLTALSQIQDYYKYKERYKQEFPDLVKDSTYNTLATWKFIKMKVGDIVVVSLGNLIIDAIGVVESDYFFDEESELRYSHFRKVKWIVKNMAVSPSNFIAKKISQQTIYEFYSKDINISAFEELTTGEINEPKNHVLIIDEINRGNVSAIFGELITLLEADKREGELNQLSVTLPYSKKKFSVPSNLHIIGTMNTADRSVEALDTALRRRFSFEEVMPDLKLLEGKVISYKKGEFQLKDILEKINDRIEVLLDRDHLIGHSYFLDIEDIDDLRNTFKNNIIPLLQEYFYGDYEKIMLVLGEDFCQKENREVKFANSKDYNRQKSIYSLRIPEEGAFESAIKKLLNLSDNSSDKE